MPSAEWWRARGQGGAGTEVPMRRRQGNNGRSRRATGAETGGGSGSRRKAEGWLMNCAHGWDGAMNEGEESAEVARGCCLRTVGKRAAFMLWRGLHTSERGCCFDEHVGLAG
ncbi:hypothetical protein CB0940_02657 [Cercospora beticola]|uniref:Uncharacterized protein n=1 Tax=Cercospora beticola TaxID=122368 RepID=A0A2G5I1G5_CERBT|nr:hypothetical protein CB0940_02657 [Cercospora beticola]PIA98645.1 hypothetical protein CB0940_02657 [Cercospora beticola]CAK1362037.1 unnamed protein product [Cercospora beticola]